MKNIPCAALLLTCLFLAATACHNPKKANKVLEDQVLALHDEAMKELPAMKRIGRSLKKELEKADSLNLPEDQRIARYDAVKAIDKADADMMAWMAAWDAESVDNVPADQARVYLEKQKKAMEQNRDDIRKARENGEKLLKQGLSAPN